MDGPRQHWLDRNRPPRVQITQDVETLGAGVKPEIAPSPQLTGEEADTVVRTPEGPGVQASTDDAGEGE